MSLPYAKICIFSWEIKSVEALFFLQWNDHQGGRSQQQGGYSAGNEMDATQG
jgi:hypothetical protein